MVESISDQLKRDVLVEGSAASKLDQPQCDFLTAVKISSDSEGASKSGSVVARGDVNSKRKTLGLAGDDTGVMGAFAVKRLQSRHILPQPSMEHL